MSEKDHQRRRHHRCDEIVIEQAYVTNEIKCKRGHRGHKGEIGLTGAMGEKGDRGEIGLTGEKGDSGEIGLTGATGEKGDTGSTGTTGEKGEKGDTGGSTPPSGGGDYAFATNSVTNNVLNGNAFTFSEGGFIYPSDIIIPPSAGQSVFLIVLDGNYMYDYSVTFNKQNTTTDHASVKCALFRNNEQVTGSVYGNAIDSSNGSFVTVSLHGFGIARLEAGDQLTLRNVSGYTIETTAEIQNCALRVVKLL